MTAPHEEQDLVGAYVLEALEPGEAQAFENHLRSCSECRAEVSDLCQVADVLPLACEPQEPSPQLRERLLAEINVDSDGDRRLSPITGDRPQSVRRPVRVPAFLGVAAAVLIVALGVWTAHQQQQINDQNKTIALQKGVAAAIASGSAVTPLRKSTRTIGTPFSPAVVVQSNASGIAYLVVKGLSPAPPNKVYQLWFMRSGVPRSAQVFTYHGGDPQIFALPVRTSGFTAAAVTIEPGPHGSRVPTTKPVLSGKLAA